MNTTELKSILANHKKWLAGKPGGVQADLSKSDLRYVDLSGVNLSKAILAYADLTGADLTGANLSESSLNWAVLSGAYLTGADLTRVVLDHADIYTATLDKKEECRKGIVLKKAIKGYKNTDEGVVITAEIPAGAVVFSINGRKCRTSTATIIDMAGHELLHSQYDYKFTYKLGQKIIIPDFDTRYNVECSTGFHFYRTKKEAKGY